MRAIPLTRGLTALVDDADYDRIAAHRWYAQPNGGKRFYAARRERHGGPLIYMHREINRTPDALHTDHIDGDGLNNQRSNLRSVTPAQNAMNKGKQRGQSSKGAWLDPSTRGANKWRAAIRIAGRLKYLGRFSTEEQAASAYAAAAEGHFGEFNRRVS